MAMPPWCAFFLPWRSEMYAVKYPVSGAGGGSSAIWCSGVARAQGDGEGMAINILELVLHGLYIADRSQPRYPLPYVAS
jgi:hypothetical protein